MIIGIGIDSVEIARFENWSDEKKEKIFTEYELKYAGENVKHLANFWATREAYVKAIGMGFRDGIGMSDVSVVHDKNGKPEIVLNGVVKKFVPENAKIHVSITDTNITSMAIVVVEA